jgi:transposase InsO family protein
LRQKPLVSSSSRACKHALPCSGSWDITWLPGPISGAFFYLYRIVDIDRRKIVGWEVHDRETAEFAAQVLERAVWAEKCRTSPRALHADNGSPPLVHARACTAGQCMKGATMKATMERLGVTASFSRPRVSNDNPTRRSPVADLQIRAQLAHPRLRENRRGADLGSRLRALV